MSSLTYRDAKFFCVQGSEFSLSKGPYELEKNL